MQGFDFDSTTGCLTISGEFTVYQAAAAHALLSETLTGGALRMLDLSGVSELDCAGLQLLLSIQRTAAPPVKVRAASEAVRAVFELLQIELNGTGEVCA